MGLPRGRWLPITVVFAAVDSLADVRVNYPRLEPSRRPREEPSCRRRGINGWWERCRNVSIVPGPVAYINVPWHP